jgi:hypothetical protein
MFQTNIVLPTRIISQGVWHVKFHDFNVRDTTNDPTYLFANHLIVTTHTAVEIHSSERHYAGDDYDFTNFCVDCSLHL